MTWAVWRVIASPWKNGKESKGFFPLDIWPCLRHRMYPIRPEILENHVIKHFKRKYFLFSRRAVTRMISVSWVILATFFCNASNCDKVTPTELIRSDLWLSLVIVVGRQYYRKSADEIHIVKYNIVRVPAYLPKYFAQAGASGASVKTNIGASDTLIWATDMVNCQLFYVIHNIFIVTSKFCKLCLWVLDVILNIRLSAERSTDTLLFPNYTMFGNAVSLFSVVAVVTQHLSHAKPWLHWRHSVWRNYSRLASSTLHRCCMRLYDHIALTARKPFFA